MYVLLFPKEFEFLHFIDYIIKLDNRMEIRFDPVLDFYLFKLNQVKFLCNYVNDSDFGFYKLLNEKFKGNKIFEEMCFILIGSCGVCNSTKENLKEWYLISKAIQSDRGILDYKNTFKQKQNKEESMISFPKSNNYQLMLYKDQKNEIHSSHFLNESNYLNSNEKKNVLFDMETYYFYDLCTRFEIRSFVSLRFVTDIVFKKNFQTNYIKEMRELISFFNSTNISNLKTFVKLIKNPILKELGLKNNIFQRKDLTKESSDFFFIKENKNIVLGRIHNVNNNEVKNRLYTILRKFKRNMLRIDFGKVMKLVDNEFSANRKYNNEGYSISNRNIEFTMPHIPEKQRLGFIFNGMVNRRKEMIDSIVDQIILSYIEYAKTHRREQENKEIKKVREKKRRTVD